ncbi:MAG TPA: exosortase H-associated membrane protein [Casimicrobiaceae bacterium]|nr:exosortase H-associated membrane protein [Casimicrobiaceae bacterium]
MPRNSLPRFIVITLLWLPVTFVVWYFTAPALLWPGAILAEGIMKGAFADLVRSVTQQGAIVQIVSTLRPGQAVAGGALTIDVDMLLYAFGLPMFAALVLAAREPKWTRILAIGYTVTLPLVAWGVVADFLKIVAVTAGPLVASQAGFSVAQRETIVFAYQFGTLILPTVVPAAVWVLTHRAFLERLRAEAVPRSEH